MGQAMKRLLLVCFASAIMCQVAISQEPIVAKPWIGNKIWIGYCPTDTTIVYGIERVTRRLWRSTDSALNWENSWIYLPPNVVREKRVVFNPNSPDTLFVLANHLVGSFDGGDTWELVDNDTFIGDIESFEYSPFHPNECLIGTQGKIYRSDNGGGAWNLVYDGNDDTVSIKAIAYDGSVDGHVLSWDGDDFIESHDGGITWMNANYEVDIFTDICEMHFDAGDNTKIYGSRLE